MHHSSVLIALIVITANIAPAGAANLLNEPEGIVFDSVHNRYLVSNWRTGTVVQIDSIGTQSYFKTGLGNCASIVIAGGVVYVACNNNKVVGLDLETAATVRERIFPGAGGCHDIALDTSGYLYATDWGSSIIYRVRLSDNTYTIFADASDGISTPLGIEFDAINNRLIIASRVEHFPIQALSVVDGTVTALTGPNELPTDGIACDEYGHYYISTMPNVNLIYRFDNALSQAPEIIVDHANGLIDMAYNPRTKILAYTSYFDHAVFFLPLTGSPRLDGYLFLDGEQGDGDSIPEGGETVEMVLAIANSGVDSLRNLNLTLSCDDPALHIVDRAADFGNVPVDGSNANELNPFIIEIPDGYIPRLVTFNLVEVWQSHLGERVDTTTATVAIGGVQILIVDDDNGDYMESYLAQGLSAMRLPHAVYVSPPAPSSEELAAYPIVFWLTGDYRAGLLDSAEIAAMTAYLDGGGNLFLTGQGIAAQLEQGGYTDFLNNYLKSDYLSASMIPLLAASSGCQVVHFGDTLAIYGSGGAPSQIVPDHLAILEGGIGELAYYNSTDLAAISYSGAYRSLFFGFGFEAIVAGDYRRTERDTVLSEILEFFSCARPATPITVAVAPGDPMHMTSHTPTISWQLPAGMTQAMYQVQVGTDDDWSVAEMWDSGPITGTETNVIYGGAELADGAIYFYRVRVHNGSSWSFWYYGLMRMNSRPTAPGNLSPADIVQITQNPPVLSHSNASDAEDDSLNYAYEVYADSLMVSLAAHASDVPQSAGGITSWIVNSALPVQDDYFWRVRAGDDFEYGDWSPLAAFYLKAPYVCGDANGDGSANVGDAVFLIAYVFKGGAAPNPLEAGDANGDGNCNVGDAVYMITYVFKGGADPICPSKK